MALPLKSAASTVDQLKPISETAKANHIPTINKKLARNINRRCITLLYVHWIMLCRTLKAANSHASPGSQTGM
jgi:hypothetical protein